MASDRLRDEVRARVDLVELVSAQTALKPVGRKLKGLCPFHKERTPSFHVDPEAGLYHCFGCGAGGDAFRFVMETEGRSFPEALESLARRVGLDPSLYERTSPAQRASRDALLAVTRAAALFFRSELKQAGPEHPAVRHLADRGFALEEALRHGVGAAPPSWDALARHLAGTGADLDAAERAGLVARRGRGEGHYDRFRGRLVFTILNVEGAPIGFGGRRLDDGDGPKYLNSSDSEIFHKGSEFYGLSWARKAMRDAGRAVLVEGYFDVLTLVRHGFAETVAALGTAITPEHAQRLKRFASEVVLALDGDAAGRSAARRALPHFLAADVRPRVVFLPADEDPDTFVRRHGAPAFEQLLADAPPLLDQVLLEHAQAAGADPRRRSEAAEVVGRLVGLLARDVEREAACRQAATLLDVPETALREAASRATTTRREAPREVTATPPVPRDDTPIPAAERRLVELLAACPALAATLPDDVADGFDWRAGAAYLRAAAAEPAGTPARWLGPAPDGRLEQIVARAAVAGGASQPDEVDRRELADCVQRVRADQARREQRRLRHAVVEAEARGASSVAELQTRYVELERVERGGR